MSGVLTTLNGYLGYRGGEGQWSFLLHRVTGLGTGLFLTVHIIDIALVYFAPRAFMDVLALYQSTLFGIGEIFLVFCVFYHGLNGLRIAAFDLFAPQRWTIPIQRRSVRLTLILALVLWLPTAAWMVRSLLVHNFGLGG
jgi:succinate dehydrogenase / fumarate reductase cytochrome b subunit